MTLRNAFGALGLDATLQAIRDRLPAVLVGGRLAVDGSDVVQPVDDNGGSLTVDGDFLTDVELRATPVPVSGPLTNAQLRASAIAISGALTDAELRASAVAISGALTDTELRASALPLPTGAATQTTLAAINTKLPTNPAAEDGNLADIAAKLPALDAGRFPVVLPPGGGGLTDTELRATPVPVSGPLTDAQLRASAVLMRNDPPPFMRVGFAEVGSGIIGKAAEELTLLQTGAGMAVNQSGGNLVVTTGTTVNAETVIRSVDTFSGSLLARVKTILSQRIVNNSFRFELADLVGESLSYTINSATSVTVTFPAVNPFTAANVGQSVRLSRITGAAGIPGRYAIASVSGLTVNFTVAAWPGSGSGTLTLYGWNYIVLEYSGTTAASINFDAQRRGWNSGNTAATINTTASPGHVAQLSYDVFTAGFADALVASNASYQWANRASRVENIPDPETELYLFIVVQNGSTAPASTTTLTVGFMQIEDQGRQKVRIAGSDPAASHAQPVQVMGGALGTQPISGTVTANIGTGSLAAGANAIGDVGQQYRANATGAATFANAACPATPVVQAVKGSAGRLLGGVLINSNVATRWLKVWNTASGGITLGTTAALFEIALPPGQPVPFSHEGGLAFGTAISVAITGGQGLTNNTAVTAGDVTGFFAFA